MGTTIHKNIATLARLCALKGITDVVLSPGSRNAPISIAMNREPGLNCHVVVDERSAAFVALGMAQKSGRCVATVCTSGTALLDQSPAIAEAYYQEIPLLVISADRPEEWIDQADSQTMRQNGILQNFVKQSYYLPTNTEDKGKWYANRMVNEAINTATNGRKGPVHLNVPCDVPLYDTEEADSNAYAIGRTQEAHISLPTIKGKVMVLAGFMTPNAELLSTIRQLAAKGVCVMAECLSNLHGKGIINNIEPTFASIDASNAAQYTPDILIVMGGALVSKHAKQYFRKNQVKQTWRVGMEENLIDTFGHITQQITCTPEDFCKALANNIEADAKFAEQWQNASQGCEEKLKAHNGKWDDVGIFAQLINQLPQGSDLHLSNGTSVRNGQLWSNHKQLNFYANRGVSGIDGCTSTAIGSAQMNKDGQTTLITGDLCFLYDSNALWNNEFPKNLRIYVINNNGGGIFRKLDGPSRTEEFEKYFVTPQSVKIATLCTAYGIGSKEVNTLNELNTATEQVVIVNLP